MPTARQIYIFSYPNPTFAAHWALWIPSSHDPKVGKVIQVTGDTISGYEHEFKRNYDAAASGRIPSVTLLSSVESRFVVDVPGDGSQTEDTTPHDAIEHAALSVDAPGPSLRKPSEQKTKVPIKNCQTWLRQLVEKLIADSIMSPEALDIVDQTPKN
ncbi:hypothetical protein BOTBODRAFT_57728 [Botryobasidium botryosum FD-172 SS1]|uniref:Uncharacterized protein n=1 Tax=Botryobasidium botryosum (strain FD-172 SS1) TaxID=930990 RepID=A0A067M5D7_BOTB1|nr:hypothetical protein BOTBODRAFT_57728 [Botryobasidium botryosum FD-172 SS1]